MITMVLTITCFSCKNEIDNDFEKISKPEITNKTIQMKNGMLVFPSMQTLCETVDAINESRSGEYTDIIKRYNFKSQKDIFEQIIIEEDAFIEKCLQLPESEIQTMNPQLAHSDLYLNMRNKDIIYEFEEDGGTSYDYALCDPMYACVLNEEGFVAIGDTVLFINKDKVVKCDDINLSKLIDIKASNESNIESKIHVLNNNVVTRSTPVDEQYPEIHYGDAFRDGDKYKYALHLHFQLVNIIYYGYPPDYYTPEVINYRYYISIKSKKKKALFGGYDYRNSTASFTGSTSSQAGAFRLGQSSYIYTINNWTSTSNSGTVGNTIMRLDFFGPMSSTVFWTWDSMRNLTFSLGNERLYPSNVTVNYLYEGTFEENKKVRLTGVIQINPYNRGSVQVFK